jgi:predicted amidohydrolase
VRAAAIQLNSNQDKHRNLDRAERLLREAAADGATLVVLPEKFNVLGGPDDLRAGAEPGAHDRVGGGPRARARAVACRGVDRRAPARRGEAGQHVGAGRTGR